ncbi:MAG: ABC transporter ATP-binding protein [Lachnospiraceae bacterium]|nr:ABC transporter ATP-binding protein [Lachnospiraceae bacterium]
MSENGKVILEVRDLKAGYNGLPAIHGVSFDVKEGQILAILGSNGAGKSSTLRALTGAITPMGGTIKYNGEDITGIPSHEIVKRGMAMVPEGRMLFGGMSVEENLQMGAYLIKDPQKKEEHLREIYKLFPRVEERKKQLASTLSGGEQQMVAIARGLMSDPKLLILDEPSLGLMPKLVQEVFEFVKEIARMGITILIVEQNANETLKMCDYAFIMQNGEIVMEGTGEQLLADENVQKAYLGG